MTRRGIVLFAAVLAAFGLAACGGGGGEGESGGSGDAESLTIGFVPSVEAGNLEARAEPLAEIMSEELGQPVEVQVLTNYIGLVEAMGNEQVDIGFLNSFGYVLAKDRYPEVEPLYKAVRFGSAFYRGQFSVRSGSEFESLADLEGADMAFVDPASTSGYLFPTNQLIQEGLLEGGENPESFFGEVVFAGSHDNALVALINEEVDVAVSYEDARAEIEEDYPEVMKQLEVLAYTDEIPNDTVSVGPSVDDELQQRIDDAIVAANESEEGQEVLDEIYGWEDIEPAEDSEYDIIRDTAEALELDLQEAAEEE
ncbi:MAG: phosphate/phosphite/phosphonate ABC transporter substrate-binding protein [Rubrobacteraceae bacterium]